MPTFRFHHIFSREGLTEENGVISLNEHADSLEKVTTVKRVARVFRDLTPQLRDKRIVASSIGPCVSTATG